MKTIPTNEFESKSYFIRCLCGCQMLECEVDTWDKDMPPSFNFTIWNHIRDGKRLFSLKEKLRWCWYILTNGNIWADDIVATEADAKELAEFIFQNISNKKSNEKTN